jgi:hypothetical protein
MYIIKNKPLPPKCLGRLGRRQHNPRFDVVDQLDVNDCLVIDNQKDVSAVRYLLRREGKKLTQRKLPEGGFGVWRVE